jgi:hypothetical protein
MQYSCSRRHSATVIRVRTVGGYILSANLEARLEHARTLGVPQVADHPAHTPFNHFNLGYRVFVR